MLSESSIVDPQSAYAVLAAKGAALAAIAPDTIAHVRVGRERVMELTHAVGTRAPRALRTATALSPAVFDKDFLAGQRAQLDDLLNRALAFYAADLDTESGFTSAQAKRRSELAGLVRAADKELFAVLTLLFGAHPDYASEVVAIAAGGGLRDDADDVLRTTKILLAEWPRVENRAPVTRAGLETAQSRATELTALIDLKDEDNPKRDLQKRAFTHWLQAYDDLNWLGRYVERSLEDWPGVSGRAPVRRAPQVPAVGTSPPTQPSVPSITDTPSA